MPLACCPATWPARTFSRTLKLRVPFPALNAAAVYNQALVADLDSGHVQALMDQPERIARLQSLLYLRPDGTKLSHQLGGLLPCERFARGERAFI